MERELTISKSCPSCGQILELGEILNDLQERKDYLLWMITKQKINNSELPRVLFHEREIWSCKLGENVGFEQDGKGTEFLRPILIVKKFNREVFWAIPLTTTTKSNPYYFNFCFREGINSSAIISQIRLIDAKRLNHLVGYMDKSDFTEIKKRLKEFLP